LTPVSRFNRDSDGAMAAASAGALDHWQILELEPGADATSLKRAFRQQARRWHPDLNGNDPVAEERFKRVNEAYAVLSDPARRRVWEAGEDSEQAAAAAADPFASGFPLFEDYLDALFGERRRSPARDNADGEDSYGEHGEDAYGENGEAAARHEDRGPDRPERDATERSGGGDVAARPASPPPTQAGSDRESLVELSPDQALNGSRVELELSGGTVVEVWTPPLAGDGWRLRLAGVAPGGGDHFLQLRVRTPEGLRIDGLRVLYQLELPPADAVLGCQVAVPTLEGPVRMRVPPRSSSGRLLRLRGRGQRHGEHRGDQLVEVRIVVNAELGEAEEALYRRLRELEDHQG
jgi:DnaJ-class molecular chaperone